MRWNWQPYYNCENWYIVKTDQYQCILKNSFPSSSIVFNSGWEVDLILYPSQHTVTKYTQFEYFDNSTSLKVIQDQAQAICERELVLFYNKMKNQLQVLEPVAEEIKMREHFSEYMGREQETIYDFVDMDQEDEIYEAQSKKKEEEKAQRQ